MTAVVTVLGAWAGAAVTALLLWIAAHHYARRGCPCGSDHQ